MSAEVLKYTRDQIEELEVAPGFEHQNLEGWIPTLATDEEIREALKKSAGSERGAAKIVGCKPITIKRRKEMWAKGKKLQLPVKK